MDDNVSTEIHCTDCNEISPYEWTSSAEENSCPKCGSLNTVPRIHISDSASLKETFGKRVKDKNYNSKRNPRYEYFEGDVLRKSDNKWMKKTRIIDKDKDKYIEKVTDPETGKVIHHNEEPLSEHIGHGSAKFKKGNKENA